MERRQEPITVPFDPEAVAFPTYTPALVPLLVRREQKSTFKFLRSKMLFPPFETRKKISEAIHFSNYSSVNFTFLLSGFLFMCIFLFSFASMRERVTGVHLARTVLDMYSHGEDVTPRQAFQWLRHYHDNVAPLRTNVRRAARRMLALAEAAQEGRALAVFGWREYAQLTQLAAALTVTVVYARRRHAKLARLSGALAHVATGEEAEDFTRPPAPAALLARMRAAADEFSAQIGPHADVEMLGGAAPAVRFTLRPSLFE